MISLFFPFHANVKFVLMEMGCPAQHYIKCGAEICYLTFSLIRISQTIPSQAEFVGIGN